MSFEVPVEFSSLTEIHKGSGDTFLIHVQDAHSNYSGQQNLANTLDFLMAKYGISLVLVEGSWKEATLTPIREAAPSKELCRQAAKSLLMQGLIAGEEYLNLISEKPMKIMGIEDEALYMKSLKSYSALADKRESALSYLRSVELALEKLKNKFYPETLIQYEKRSAASGFESGVKELFSISKEKNVDLSDFPELQKLAALQKKEKAIDFDAANLEEVSLVEEVSRKGGRYDLDNQLDKIKRMKNQKVAQFTFFRGLLKAAESVNVNLSAYPNLTRYADYLQDFADLDLDEVLREIEKAQDRVYVSLLEGEDARLIRAIDRYTKLLNSAYRIRMTTQEFKLFEANEPDFATVSTLAFINRKLAETGYFDSVLPYKKDLEDGKAALVQFYDSVDQRDLAFMQNAERILKEEKQKVAILISGGYHTPHLKKLMRESGHSLAVLTPIVTSETNQEKYERLLLLSEEKEIKTVEFVHGETRRNDKPLSRLEKDLAGKKAEVSDLRAMAAAIRMPTRMDLFREKVTWLNDKLIGLLRSGRKNPDFDPSGSEKTGSRLTYSDKKEVNGINISVGFDRGYNAYTLYFPQISLANNRGVSDHVFIISENPEDAIQVFQKAVQLARQGLDVYDVYKKAEAFSRELPAEDPEEIPDVQTARYHDAAVVNGIEIVASWDNGYGDYVLYFPSISIGNERGVSDQLFRISENPETARQVFQKAVQLARRGLDVYDVYKQAEIYARKLSGSRVADVAAQIRYAGTIREDAGKRDIQYAAYELGGSVFGRYGHFLEIAVLDSGSGSNRTFAVQYDGEAVSDPRQALEIIDALQKRGFQHGVFEMIQTAANDQISGVDRFNLAAEMRRRADLYYERSQGTRFAQLDPKTVQEVYLPILKDVKLSDALQMLDEEGYGFTADWLRERIINAGWKVEDASLAQAVEVAEEDYKATIPNLLFAARRVQLVQLGLDPAQIKRPFPAEYAYEIMGPSSRPTFAQAFDEMVFPQIERLAEKLKEQMDPVKTLDRVAQLDKLKELLQSPDFAREMAEWLEGAYYRGVGQEVPPFLTAEQETATTAKSVKEEKIAMNLAGFYALEAGIGYLSETSGKLPVDILDAILAKTLPYEDMLLLARFANATWKASQPFRSLSRIGKPNFIPAAALSREELEKDFVQIREAATKLRTALAGSRLQAPVRGRWADIFPTLVEWVNEFSPNSNSKLTLRIIEGKQMRLHELERPLDERLDHLLLPQQNNIPMGGDFSVIDLRDTERVIEINVVAGSRTATPVRQEPVRGKWNDVFPTLVQWVNEFNPTPEKTLAVQFANNSQVVLDRPLRDNMNDRELFKDQAPVDRDISLVDLRTQRVIELNFSARPAGAHLAEAPVRLLEVTNARPLPGSLVKAPEGLNTIRSLIIVTADTLSANGKVGQTITMEADKGIYAGFRVTKTEEGLLAEFIDPAKPNEEPFFSLTISPDDITQAWSVVKDRQTVERALPEVWQANQEAVDAYKDYVTLRKISLQALRNTVKNLKANTIVILSSYIGPEDDAAEILAAIEELKADLAVIAQREPSAHFLHVAFEFVNANGVREDKFGDILSDPIPVIAGVTPQKMFNSILNDNLVQTAIAKEAGYLGRPSARSNEAHNVLPHGPGMVLQIVTAASDSMTENIRQLYQKIFNIHAVLETHFKAVKHTPQGYTAERLEKEGLFMKAIAQLETQLYQAYLSLKAIGSAA